MRVNVYDHEIRDRVEVVTAVAENTGMTFFGVRIYVGEDVIHEINTIDSDVDDDTGGVTWWVPWTKKQGHNIELLRRTFDRALDCINEIEENLGV